MLQDTYSLFFYFYFILFPSFFMPRVWGGGGQLGQSYVEQQDNLTVTEWMRKQARVTPVT